MSKRDSEYSLHKISWENIQLIIIKKCVLWRTVMAYTANSIRQRQRCPCVLHDGMWWKESTILSFLILDPERVSFQFQAPAVLPSGKEPLLSVKQKAGWVPGPV
jgi:hypothetical protein